MKNNEKREILLNSSIIKVQKDQKGKISKQVIKMKWKNWVDYWSVDFDFQSKQEILKDENNKEKWTGDYIFENEWQSFKTKEKKELEFQTPPRPLIEGKKIAETICYSYFKQKKVPIKILRVFHTYGPMMNLNDGRVMMDFIKNAINEKEIIIKSKGNQKRTFCYISDLIEGILIVLLKGKNGEAYNLANKKEYYSINKLAKVISKFTKKK